MVIFVWNIWQNWTDVISRLLRRESRHERFLRDCSFELAMISMTEPFFRCPFEVVVLMFDRSLCHHNHYRLLCGSVPSDNKYCLQTRIAWGQRLEYIWMILRFWHQMSTVRIQSSVFLRDNFLKWPIPGVFFFIIVFSIKFTVNVQYKFCRWLDFNRRHLESEATTLPTNPQLLFSYF